MPSEADIEESASGIRDPELRQIYLRLSHEILRRTRNGFDGSWTFRSFAKWIQVEQSNRKLHECVQLLVVSDSPKLLLMHFRLHLPNDDVGIEVPDQDVQVAFANGYLEIDGHQVRNFANYLSPYFVPAKDADND